LRAVVRLHSFTSLRRFGPIGLLVLALWGQLLAQYMAAQHQARLLGQQPWATAVCRAPQDGADRSDAAATAAEPCCGAACAAVAPGLPPACHWGLQFAIAPALAGSPAPMRWAQTAPRPPARGPPAFLG